MDAVPSNPANTARPTNPLFNDNKLKLGIFSIVQLCRFDLVLLKFPQIQEPEPLLFRSLKSFELRIARAPLAKNTRYFVGSFL